MKEIGSATQRDVRYPIGLFMRPQEITREMRVEGIQDLEKLPWLLRDALDGLDENQLGTPYREGGWTVRQLVHHVADSHMNVFIRVRLALTEAWPKAKLYDQDAWVELADSKEAPVRWSLELVERLHARWVTMLRALSEEQWQLGYVHRDDGRVTVELATLLYAWHGRHHLAHITGLCAARGW